MTAEHSTPETSTQTDLSFVIPAYNEEENIPLLHQRITENLEKLGKSYEIIFIDDGSTDKTAQVMEELANSDSHTRCILLRTNFGKSRALNAGFRNVNGDIVFTMDADLQDDPDEIPRFLEKLEEGCDLVSGWKEDRKDPLGKTLPSKLFNKVTSVSTGIKLHDFNCGYKAYRREVVERLDVYGEMHRYLPVLAHQNGFRIGEIPVRHHARQFGKSKFGLERILRGLFDFLTVFFITKYADRPMHFFGLAGFLMCLVGFIINAYLTVIWFMGESIGGRPLLFLGILLLLMGAQFFSVGILGEMMTKSQRRDVNVDDIIKRKIG